MKKSKHKKNSRNAKWLCIVTIFVFSVVFFCVGYYLSGNNAECISQKFSIFEPNKESEKEKCVDCVRRQIDGVYVEPGKDNLYPFAVMIENHTEARPQYGLSEANLVFEAEAEGGITRFLAVFAGDQDIEKIGPIRSARPYYVDWSQELSALYVHCGGSPEALVKISKENIFNLNEFYKGKYFWRDQEKDAPHNIFTSSENIKEYFNLKNIDEGKFLSWQYKGDEILENRPEKNEININFKLSAYVVKWEYDMTNNEYVRFMGGGIHKDAGDNEIKAKNVLIQYVEAEVIDDKLRLEMQHIGEGEAVVCIDGQCEDGEWKKTTSSSRTRFYNTEGEEFKFNAGTTWVDIVRPEYEVNIL